jgi:hypothetical protein
MREPPTTLLNVAILPPDPASAEAASLSDQLHRRGGLFRIDGLRRFAHLTVYMARFATSDVGPVLEKTATLLAAQRPFPVRHTGYHLTAGDYYEVSYERSAALMSLHETVVDGLRGLRFSPGAPVVEEYFGPYSPEQRRNAETTGYDLAHDLYRPHVTITRFAGRPEIALPTAATDLSFPATTIGLFTADPLGAVTKNLATWRAGVVGAVGFEPTTPRL